MSLCVYVCCWVNYCVDIERQRWRHTEADIGRQRLCIYVCCCKLLVCVVSTSDWSVVQVEPNVGMIRMKIAVWYLDGSILSHAKEDTGEVRCRKAHVSYVHVDLFVQISARSFLSYALQDMFVRPLGLTIWVRHAHLVIGVLKYDPSCTSTRPILFVSPHQNTLSRALRHLFNPHVDGYHLERRLITVPTESMDGIPCWNFVRILVIYLLIEQL